MMFSSKQRLDHVKRLGHFSTSRKTAKMLLLAAVVMSCATIYVNYSNAQKIVPEAEIETERKHDRPGSLFDPVEITPLCARPNQNNTYNNITTTQEQSNNRRRIIDVIFINVELEMLELRLLELWNVVDIFFISESTISWKANPLINQTLEPKPLTLTEHWDDFSQFHSKMVLHVVPPEISLNSTYDHQYRYETAQRDEQLVAIKRMLDPQPNDLLIYADLDEIPRPHIIEEIACGTRAHRFPVCLETFDSFYYYNFRCHIKKEWTHRPLITPYIGKSRGRCSSQISNASTHCSSCFGSVEEVRTKILTTADDVIEGVSHKEVVDLESILLRVRNCKDVYLRDFVDSDMDLRDTVDFSKVPLIVGKHPERWPYLLGMGPLYDDEGKQSGSNQTEEEE